MLIHCFKAWDRFYSFPMNRLKRWSGINFLDRLMGCLLTETMRNTDAERFFRISTTFKCSLDGAFQCGCTLWPVASLRYPRFDINGAFSPFSNVFFFSFFFGGEEFWEKGKTARSCALFRYTWRSVFFSRPKFLTVTEPCEPWLVLKEQLTRQAKFQIAYKKKME